MLNSVLSSDITEVILFKAVELSSSDSGDVVMFRCACVRVCVVLPLLSLCIWWGKWHKELSGRGVTGGQSNSENLSAAALLSHSKSFVSQNQYASLLRSFISCAVAWTINSAFSRFELLHSTRSRSIFDIFPGISPLPWMHLQRMCEIHLNSFDFSRYLSESW